MGGNVNLITAENDVDFVRNLNRELLTAFPEFMYHNETANLYWKELYRSFPEYQFAMCSSDDNTPVALGNSFPLQRKGPLKMLPDEGLEWGLRTAVEQFHAGMEPNAICAFQVIVADKARRRGFSFKAVQAMIDIGKSQKLNELIAPVRPNRKSEYPELSMEEYIGLKRDDGLPLDDWLRVHARLGGEIIKICHESYTVKGSVADWEKWTGMVFPASGLYNVEGALAPVEIDLELDHGIYTEPNVWMKHEI